MKLTDIVNSCEDLLKENKLTEAYNLYSKWIEESISESKISNKDKAVAYNNRGHILYFKVEFEDAIEDYNEALKYNPNFSSAYYNRGTILYRMGYFSEAVDDMIKATELEPTNSEYKLALQRCKEGQESIKNSCEQHKNKSITSS